MSYPLLVPRSVSIFHSGQHDENSISVPIFRLDSSQGHLDFPQGQRWWSSSLSSWRDFRLCGNAPFRKWSGHCAFAYKASCTAGKRGKAASHPGIGRVGTRSRLRGPVGAWKAAGVWRQAGGENERAKAGCWPLSSGLVPPPLTHEYRCPKAQRPDQGG